MFVMDPDTSMSGMLKQATAFGMGGWWLGGGHTIPNTEFMQQVQQQLPNKDQGVIIACQKGLRCVNHWTTLCALIHHRMAPPHTTATHPCTVHHTQSTPYTCHRSLAAAEQLVRAGYTQVGWIAGGLDTAKASALPTPENKDLRYAGIGGLSEALGWTEVQQENSPSNGPSLVLKLVRGGGGALFWGGRGMFYWRLLLMHCTCVVDGESCTVSVLCRPKSTHVIDTGCGGTGGRFAVVCC